MNHFGHASARLMIGAVDDGDLSIEAQYNPAELQRDKAATWAPHGVLGKADGKHLEYTGAQPRTMTLALVFDGFESGETVEPMVEKLERMAIPTDLDAPDPALRAPPLCVVAWGDRGIRPFRCVVESVSTKYTMFASDGSPVRATCTVKVKEAVIPRRGDYLRPAR
jgi:hypothetical protein